MVAAPHRGACFLLVEKPGDEISATGDGQCMPSVLTDFPQPHSSKLFAETLTSRPVVSYVVAIFENS